MTMTKWNEPGDAKVWHPDEYERLKLSVTDFDAAIMRAYRFRAVTEARARQRRIVLAIIVGCGISLFALFAAKAIANAAHAAVWADVLIESDGSVQ